MLDFEQMECQPRCSATAADLNELTPWQQTSTNFLDGLAGLVDIGHRQHNLPTQPSARAAVIRRRRPSRTTTHRRLTDKPSTCNKEQFSETPLNVISPRLCYASITSGNQPNQKDCYSTQLFRDGLDDKENIVRLKESIGENRRNTRLEKIIRIVNPRRTNSILIERSRLRVLVTEELENRCPQPKEVLHNKSLSSTNHYRKLEQHLQAINRQPKKKMTGSDRPELRYLPDVTKMLYEKYSLNKTRSSFRGRLLV